MRAELLELVVMVILLTLVRLVRLSKLAMRVQGLLRPPERGEAGPLQTHRQS